MLPSLASAFRHRPTSATYLYDLITEIINLDKKLAKTIDKYISFFGGSSDSAPILHPYLQIYLAGPSYKTFRRQRVFVEEDEKKWYEINENFWRDQDRDNLFAVVGRQPQQDGRLMTFR